MRKLLLLVVSLALFTGPALPVAAQQGNEQDVDRVVAVVGDSIVLLSQVLQREAEIRAQGGAIPELPEARQRFLEEVLEDLVRDQLLLQAALQDTLLSVDDEDVDARAQEQVARTQQAFGGAPAMEQALQREGMSMQTYREMIREQIRQQLLVQQYVSRHAATAAVEVTDTETREFFEAQRSTLSERPASVTFLQIVIPVQPSDESKEAARSRIEDLLAQAREGADFGQLATEHSQDPGSASAGGDLGWFRRGNFADEFEEAAFNLLEGEISEVVETVFGYHIIEVQQIRFAERRARHILIRPSVGPDDVVRAREQATSLAARADTEDFRDLGLEFHDPQMPDSATIPISSLDQTISPAFGQAVRAAAVGSVAGPVEFEFRGDTKVALVKVLERREAGQFSYEDLEGQIRSVLMQEKQVDALVDELRGKTFVDVRAN